jgi:hypothetical protein
VQSISDQIRFGVQLPTAVYISVRLGQLLAFTLATLTVHEDILSSAVELGHHLCDIGQKTENPYAANRIFVVILLLMRLSVGSLSLISATLVIVTSDELLAIFQGCHPTPPHPLAHCAHGRNPQYARAVAVAALLGSHFLRRSITWRSRSPNVVFSASRSKRRSLK